METRNELDLGAGTDNELLREYLGSGREEAFAKLVRRHGGMVLGVCRSVLGNTADAEDAAQAVFVTLARKARSLGGHTSLAGWLHRVARYVALRAGEAAAIRRRHEQEAVRMKQEILGQETAIPSDALHAALETVPEKYRVALLLHHLEGHTEEETATLVGCSCSAVSSRLSRGRQMLRERVVKGGMAATASMVVTALGRQAAAQPLGVFVDSTTRIAVALAAGKTASVSAGVMGLCEGAMHMMRIVQMKLMAAVAAGLVVTGGVGMYVGETLAASGEAAATAPVAATANVNAGELLAKFQAAVSWETRASLDAEITLYSAGLPNQPTTTKDLLTYHRDGQRAKWTESLTRLDDKGQPTGKSLWVMDLIADGRRVLANDSPVVNATIRRRDVIDVENAKIAAAQYGGFLEGHIGFADDKTLSELLSAASDLKARAGEVVNGVATFEISGTTPYGHIRMWVAPERGNNAAKFEIQLGEGDLFQASTLKESDIVGGTYTVTMDSFANVKGKWVVQAGTAKWVATRADGSEIKETTQVVRKRIDLDPDFRALHAFEAELPEGMLVMDDEFPGIRFIMHDGRQEVYTGPEPMAPTLPSVPKTQPALERTLTAPGDMP
jgi:RNA polymerase sigma factor (sigma-70 family)